MVCDSQWERNIVIMSKPLHVAIDPALTATVVFSGTDVEVTGKPNDQSDIGKQC